MENIDRLSDELRALGFNVDYYGPQHEESVRVVESELCVVFPPSYRQFLLEYGGSVATQIAGIYGNRAIDENDANVVYQTRRRRKNDGLSEHHVAFDCDYEADVIATLNVSKSDDRGEFSVYLFDINFKKYKFAGNSFGEYYEATLRGLIDAQRSMVS